MARKRKSALRKNILREIKGTKSRFFAIFAIIGISVGFFSGLKSSSPTMLHTAKSYLEDNHLMDLRIQSTVGFDEEDIRALAELEDVEAVMPGYMADLIVTHDEIDSVVKVYSVPQKTTNSRVIINEPILREGRLPKNEGECAIESYFLKMSGYHLGDTISFNPSIEGKKTTDIVRHLEYKIVGLVDSPLYLTYLRGNSTVGDGTIAFYMMLPPEEFATERYTAVFMKTKASAGGADPFNDAYQKEIDREKELLESVSQASIRRFNDTILSDARKELEDGEKEYNQKKEEALQKLADGEKELREGELEFYTKTGDARKQIEDGEQALLEGKEQLARGQDTYKTGIEEAKQKLADAQTQYDEGLAAFHEAKSEYDTQIDAAEKQMAAAKSEFDLQYQIFYSSTKPQAETKLTLLKAGIDLCQEGIDRVEEELEKLREKKLIGELVEDQIAKAEQKLSDYRAKLAEYRQQYEEGTRQLSEGEAKLEEAKQQLTEAQQTLQEKKTEGAVKLNEAQMQLDLAQGQLQNGKLEYETALTTGLMELQAGQTKLSESEKQLESGKAQLKEQMQQGMLSMKQGREELAKGKYEARVQLGDAEKKLQEGKDQISSLENAKWYIFDRNDNPGYSGLHEDADRVDNIAKVFPVFFLLIAGLVCFTTMTRMVEEHRTETGTLKALGYSNFSIAVKYLIYGGLAALTGSAVGAAIGILTLPVIIVDTYRIMYTFPPTMLSVDWKSLLLASGAGVLCISVVSMMACYKDLLLTPAALMRPKAPKPGKRILLEHIRPLWKHLNFTSKVTARNLFRYKARFFMTVIGVAGCTALMIAALGLRDSTTGIAHLQFDELTRYDQVYALSESGSAEEKEYLMAQFHQDERFSNCLLSNMSWGSIQKEKGGKSVSIRMIMGQDEEQFRKMFILRDRKTQKETRLSDDGIILAERLGDVLEIREGDAVTLTLEDEKYQCRVDGFTENYAGSLGYMTPAYYQKLTGKEPEYNLVLTRIAPEERDNERDIANDYMKLEDVITVTSITDQVNAMLDMLKSLDFVIFVMIFCAGLLAVVVLYNLTNINIAERVREIATIKVLGFYNMETANFIYREGIVLTFIGALAGLGLGNLFETFIIESIQMDNVMFPKQIAPLSFLLAFVLTIAFSMIVNFIMYFKMNKISMVESLKSVD